MIPVGEVVLAAVAEEGRSERGPSAPRVYPTPTPEGWRRASYHVARIRHPLDFAAAHLRTDPRFMNRAAAADARALEVADPALCANPKVRSRRESGSTSCALEVSIRSSYEFDRSKSTLSLRVLVTTPRVTPLLCLIPSANGRRLC